jgi:ABC-type transport system involved in multi-copper enzyme maturation permease subunit
MEQVHYSIWLSARAILGILVMGTAILGGVIATYYNVRNVSGPKERAFVVQVCTVSWLIVFSLLLLTYFLPSPHRFVVAALYLLVCPLMVYRWTNKHQLIRMIEERSEPDDQRIEGRS